MTTEQENLTPTATASRKVRWGIISNARINRRFVPGLQGAGNAQLVGIASRSQEAADKAAAQWGATLAYGSYEALLADPSIEAVYIPLPNNLHAEWAIKTLAAGKHVLVEKPIALNVADVERIAETAQRYHVQAMEAFVYHYHPQHARVRELIADGTIGEARVLHTSLAFVPDFSKFNIRLEAGLGGGATWDVGCYGVSVSRLIFGREPISVYAESYSRPGFDVDTSVAAILDFGEGRRAILDYGFDYGRNSFYEVFGSNGTIKIDSMWQEPDAPARIHINTSTDSRVEEFPLMNHFSLEVAAFSQALLDHKPVPLTLTDSIANARVLVKLLESIREKRPIAI
jgi:predicted dehydrogenase